MPGPILLVLSVAVAAVAYRVMDGAAARQAAARPKTDLSHRIVTRTSDGRRQVTVDDCGQARSGPHGAWWANLTPRACDALGMSGEIARGRALAWNALVLAGMGYAALWAVLVFKVPVATLGLAVLAAVVIVAAFVGVMVRTADEAAARERARIAALNAVDRPEIREAVARERAALAIEAAPAAQETERAA